MTIEIKPGQIATVLTAVIVLDHLARLILRKCKPGGGCCDKCRAAQPAARPEPMEADQFEPLRLLTS